MLTEIARIFFADVLIFLWTWAWAHALFDVSESEPAPDVDEYGWTRIYPLEA